MRTFKLSYFRIRNKIFTEILFLTILSVSVSAETQFFKFAEIKFAAEITAPENGESEGRTFSAGNAGLRLSFRDADFRSYVTLPKTDVSTLEFPNSLNDVRYGASVSMLKESFPVTVKAGILSYSKSMSRLKNPAPSYTANPLKQSFGFSAGLSQTLPTQTSSVQPVSAAVSFNGKKLRFPFNADFMLNEDGTAAASAYFRTKISRYIYTETAFTGGLFFLENSSSYLKRNGCLFEPDSYKAFCMETAFRSPVLKADFSAGVHESPYGSPAVWIDVKTRSAYRAFLTDFSLFAVPTADYSPKSVPILGADSSVCKTVFQMSVNPQLTLSAGKSTVTFIRFGMNVTGARKITGSSSFSMNDVLKISAGIKFEGTYTDIKTVFTAANILISGRPSKVSLIPEESYTASISAERTSDIFTAVFSGSLKYCPPPLPSSSEKHIINTSLTVTPGKTRRITVKGSLYHYMKDREPYSSSMEGSVTYRLRTGAVRSSLKCSVILPFKY